MLHAEQRRHRTGEGQAKAQLHEGIADGEAGDFPEALQGAAGAEAVETLAPATVVEVHPQFLAVGTYHPVRQDEDVAVPTEAGGHLKARPLLQRVLDAVDEFTAGLGRDQPGAVEIKAVEFLGSDGEAAERQEVRP